MNPDSYLSWKGWNADAFGATPPSEAGFFDREIGPRLAPGSQVLEIGFGNGAFLGWCRARGHAYQGVEQNPSLVARARQHGVQAALEVTALALAPASIDAVVAIDVFEHLDKPELVALLQQLRPAMRAGGVLIARFPNGDSPFSLPYQNGDLTHRTAIGSRMLVQLGALTGWRLRSYAAPALQRTGLSLRGRCLQAVGAWGRHLIEALVSRLYLSGQAVVLTPNCIAVMVPA
jgi:SAM-dependent methyltransferase